MIVCVLLFLVALLLTIGGATFIILALIRPFYGYHGPIINDADVMVEPNPGRKPLPQLTHDTVRITPRQTAQGRHIRNLSFEDNKVYQGWVGGDRPSRIICHKTESKEQKENADRVLAATRAQHAANIVGACRIYGFLRDNQHQFFFKEMPTRCLEVMISTRVLIFLWQTRLQMARDVATTMAQAHAQGLTHGNLSGFTVQQFNEHAKVDGFGLDSASNIEDPVTHDIEMFGRLFWRVIHRRPLPPSRADLDIPAPVGCPVELAAAVRACVRRVNERPADFNAVCKLLGCPFNSPSTNPTPTPRHNDDDRPDYIAPASDPFVPDSGEHSTPDYVQPMSPSTQAPPPARIAAIGRWNDGMYRQ
ncbi:hypothetical protein J8273_3439 [Carpediemonas membranifera]|uniref:Protein kinase domain-containing protein n=1 Tax=Carpediemonas membranifera TaxID=201153 RepID=A0A8J6AV58_9EUKA|nr:hypothetical protein J8273_3439 [Carpediemonas membranifera]|eukprot:KAG9393305.1 hypothetical protein J8273_3439 [Carpediemonas membranifera]